ncbi:MAG: protein kinase [bacterium]|nr:protein kinase [bacterium]
MVIQADARVGGFVIEHKLGSGAMGDVYRAVDPDGCVVAVKILRPDSGLPRAKKRFLQEAQILERLDHPHIARVLESELDSDTPFLAIEFVPGARAITDFVDAEQLSLGARIELLRDVADAVAHAHDARVVHRDLKPGNILVGDDAEPKVIDFGIARWDERTRSTLTGSGHVIGTPGYISPEVEVLGTAAATRAADVYSLGVILFELMTGGHPFAEETRGALPPSARRVDASLPVHLDWVVRRALETDPVRRYQHARDFAVDLDSILQGRRPSASPISFARRAAAATRRYWLVGALAAGLAMLMIIAKYREDFRRIELLEEIDEGRVTLAQEIRSQIDTRSNRMIGQLPDGIREAGEALSRLLANYGDWSLERDPRRRDILEWAAFTAAVATGARPEGTFTTSDRERARTRIGARHDELGLAINATWVMAYDSMRNQRWVEAETILREIVDASPRDGLAHGLLMLTLIRLDRSDDARVVGEQAVAMGIEEPSVYMNMGSLLHHSELESEREQAERMYREALRLDPDSLYPYRQLAALIGPAGRELEAYEVLLEGEARISSGIIEASLLPAERRDSITGIYQNLGIACAILRRGGESLYWMELAIGNAVGKSIQMALRGRIAISFGFFEDAACDYAASFALEPSRTETLIGRAEALGALQQRYRGERYGGALEAFVRALADHGEKARALTGMALLLHDRGEPSAGLVASRQAIEVDPNHAKGWSVHALMLMAHGEHDRAAQAASIALGLDPDHSAARFNRAGAYARLGEPALAMADYFTLVLDDLSPDRENERAFVRGKALAQLAALTIGVLRQGTLGF